MQYAEGVVLHIETDEFIPDDAELTSLFIQVQGIIKNRLCPIYITHIQSGSYRKIKRTIKDMLNKRKGIKKKRPQKYCIMLS